MAIRLDREGCIACGHCIDICLGDCLRPDGEDKPYIRYQGECWTCGACESECPQKAIRATIDWLIV